MSRWVIKGLRTGIVTTRYPAREENAPGISPGLPQSSARSDADSEVLALRCPTDALRQADGQLKVDRARCIHCYRCARGVAKPIPWETGFEWASLRGKSSVFPNAFQRSLHIRVVDAGDCGACLNEVKLLNNPFYNMHRVGFFITPTPRKADILLVVGPVTDHMKTPLLKAYEAMPTPKRVMAAGACALSGGLFGPGFVTGPGVADVLSVDVEIPGCPPPPLAILHGLLAITGRRQADTIPGPAGIAAKEGGNER
ncbi:MAG: NADH:ubiquinone oxidoreductase [Planctomycetes bacterium]|nr:NADH:ubiquinone oxidoreductase [Planctomycetota bacterium]